MIKSNLAIIQPKSKPLSSVEAERLIEETTSKLIAAVSAGDREAYRSLKVDQDFNIEALEAAREREAAEASVAERARIDVLKPDALEACRNADPNVALAEEIADWRSAIELLAGIAKRMPAKLQKLRGDQKIAIAKSNAARVPFVPLGDLGEQMTIHLLFPIMHEIVIAANLSAEGIGYLPIVQLAPRGWL